MSKDREVFAGGVAVITGAGAGIGAGLARRAGELGMKVVVSDISKERAEQVAEDIRAKGGEAVAMVVDVSKPSELDSFAEEIFAKFGDVRLLVNNAGIETIGFVWEIPTERWEQTLNVNIHGIVHGVRAFAPRMIASGKPGWIANLSSIGGFGIMPTQTAYIMSKHAIQAFSECLYLEMELKKAPIHVSSIIPGMVKTSIFDAEAGAGEPENASGQRKVMHDMMAQYGMDLAEASKIIFDQMADRKFWVSTQPDMTEAMVDGRIRFLTEKTAPQLAEQTRHILGI